MACCPPFISTCSAIACKFDPLRSTIKAKSSLMGGFAFNMQTLGVRTPVGSDFNMLYYFKSIHALFFKEL